ncbi:MAG: hypothetical protein IPM63_14985 [Acidobacteriota bacterium]|nr:MAG: hypothetical protein IPM63_14985 [Acidobacteriota bacterium]
MINARVLSGIRALSALVVLMTSVFAAHAQETNDRKVERIRKIYSETNAKIEKVEKGGEEDRLAGIAVNELVVNKTGKSWPAVGNFREVYRFYYDSDGESPYPSKLLKISKATESAARKYFEEYVFDRSGNLIFYFEKTEDGEVPLERRVYFDSGKAFRFIDDGKTRDKLSEEDEIVANDILATENTLRGIFEATLN